jgi:hypothetical protein
MKISRSVMACAPPGPYISAYFALELGKKNLEKPTTDVNA